MRSDWKRPQEWAGPADGWKRIMMFVSYDGSDFHGWQSQGDGCAVQDRLSEVISSLAEEDIQVYGSGRTDSGVHALDYVMNFHADLKLPLCRLPLALNTEVSDAPYPKQ